MLVLMFCWVSRFFFGLDPAAGDIRQLLRTPQVSRRPRRQVIFVLAADDCLWGQLHDSSVLMHLPVSFSLGH